MQKIIGDGKRCQEELFGMIEIASKINLLLKEIIVIHETPLAGNA
jgi:hypothetical protein